MIKTWSANGEGKPTVVCGIIFWFRKKFGEVASALYVRITICQVKCLCGLLLATSGLNISNKD